MDEDAVRHALEFKFEEGGAPTPSVYHQPYPRVNLWTDPIA